MISGCLPADTTGPVVLFGSKEYAPLFAALTADISAPKTVFYRSKDRPDLPGCRAVEYQTSRSRNWQYECASAFRDGKARPTDCALRIAPPPQQVRVFRF